MNFRTDEKVYRFQFATPAWFLGVVKTDKFLLDITFSGLDDRRQGAANSSASPYRIRRLTFSFETPALDEKIGVYSSLGWLAWMGEEVSALLGAFYGKLIVNLGHLQAGSIMTYPAHYDRPCWAFEKPPFNDQPRLPAGPMVNLTVADGLLTAYLEKRNPDRMPLILRAAEFYRMSLENYTERPEMAFTLLISTLECLVEVIDHTEGELFDADFLSDLKMIEQYCGLAVRNRITSRLYQVRRKVAHLVDELVTDDFFESRESLNAVLAIKNRDELRSRILAAYDLRSRILHTGDRTGLWIIEQDLAGSEITVAELPIEDAKLKKAIRESVTLAGLERIVSCVLRNAIRRWLESE